MIFGGHCAKKEQTFLPGNTGAWLRGGGLLARLHTVVQAAMEAQAPLGYEDETGFHFQDEDKSHSLQSGHWNGSLEASLL